MADLFHTFHTIVLLSICVLGLFIDQRPGLLHRWWSTRSRHHTEHHLQRPARLVRGMRVLFVLDPNFFLCWESVPVDQVSNTTLLPWILGLKDALSRTADYPDGLDLKVNLGVFSNAWQEFKTHLCCLAWNGAHCQAWPGPCMQIPDAEHSAPEVAGFATFRGLIEGTWQDCAANVSLPSNLILMYQAAMCGSMFYS